jgi:hypothetical protein
LHLRLFSYFLIKFLKFFLVYFLGERFATKGVAPSRHYLHIVGRRGVARRDSSSGVLLLSGGSLAAGGLLADFRRKNTDREGMPNFVIYML